jgi:hypothetical protein
MYDSSELDSRNEQAFVSCKSMSLGETLVSELLQRKAATSKDPSRYCAKDWIVKRTRHHVNRFFASTRHVECDLGVAH